MKGIEKFEPGSFYHIVNHAVGKDNLFKNEDNYALFLERYMYYMQSVCDTLAYCLMPNHIHILIKVNGEVELQEHGKFSSDYHKLVMQQLSNLLNSYAKSYNGTYERKGALWLDCTRRFKVDSDGYLSTVISYIHNNPVRHGFVDKVEDWCYSSYFELLSNRLTFLNRDTVMNWFGGKQHFIDFHKVLPPVMVKDWE